MHLFLALLLLAAQGPEEKWKAALRARPIDAEARFSLAALYEREHRYTEAIRELDQLIPAEISRPGAQVLRGGALLGLGREREAEGAVRRAVLSREFVASDLRWLVPRLTGAVAVVALEALVKRGEATLDERRQLVTAYEQVNRWKDARQALESLAASEPGSLDHLYELARVAYRLRDAEGALGYLGHVRDLTPADPRAHFLFGLLLVELNLPAEARKSLTKASELAPDNPDYNFTLGGVILRDRDPSPALAYFQKYVAARPDDPRGHYALGLAYYLTSAYAESTREMQSASASPATRAGATFFLAKMAREDDRLEEAADLLAQSIKALPNFAQAYAELARVRFSQKRDSDGTAALNRALQLDHDNFLANSILLARYQKTHDPRFEAQQARLKGLDERRSKEWELTMRGIEVKPYQ